MNESNILISIDRLQKLIAIDKFELQKFGS